jgi:hypothetical protein
LRHLPASESAVKLRLARSYQRVFLGQADDTDREIVLVDLASYTGFYRVTPPGEDGGRDVIVFNEGMRAAFGRIFMHIRMTNEEMASLETAARQTAAGIGLDAEPTME